MIFCLICFVILQNRIDHKCNKCKKMCSFEVIVEVCKNELSFTSYDWNLEIPICYPTICFLNEMTLFCSKNLSKKIPKQL